MKQINYESEVHVDNRNFLEKFLEKIEEHAGRKPAKGIFGADMKVSLLNDGPVTIIVDSKLKF